MTSYICPICWVASNLKPQYNDKNDTTAVSHYFTYCGHKADDNGWHKRRVNKFKEIVECRFKKI